MEGGRVDGWSTNRKGVWGGQQLEKKNFQMGLAAKLEKKKEKKFQFFFLSGNKNWKREIYT